MTSQTLTTGSTLLLRAPATLKSHSPSPKSYECKEGLFYVYQHETNSKRLTLISPDVWYLDSDNYKKYSSFLFTENEISKLFVLKDYREINNTPFALGQVWRFAIPLFNVRVLIDFPALSEPHYGYTKFSHVEGKHVPCGRTSCWGLRQDYFLERPSMAGDIVF